MSRHRLGPSAKKRQPGSASKMPVNVREQANLLELKSPRALARKHMPSVD